MKLRARNLKKNGDEKKKKEKGTNEKRRETTSLAYEGLGKVVVRSVASSRQQQHTRHRSWRKIYKKKENLLLLLSCWASRPRNIHHTKTGERRNLRLL